MFFGFPIKSGWLAGAPPASRQKHRGRQQSADRRLRHGSTELAEVRAYQTHDPRLTRSGKRRTLNADVEVDDAVIVDVDFSVVVEIAVEPAARSQRDVEIDSAVVIDVDLAVQVRVAAVGVHDQRLIAGHSLAGPNGGRRGRGAFRLCGA